MELFCKLLRTQKFTTGNFFWAKYPRNPYALRIQKMYMKGGYNKCLTLFWSAEVIVYDPTLIRFGSDILKIVAASVCFNTAFKVFFGEEIG